MRVFRTYGLAARTSCELGKTHSDIALSNVAANRVRANLTLQRYEVGCTLLQESIQSGGKDTDMTTLRLAWIIGGKFSRTNVRISGGYL